MHVPETFRHGFYCGESPRGLLYPRIYAADSQRQPLRPGGAIPYPVQDRGEAGPFGESLDGIGQTGIGIFVVAEKGYQGGADVAHIPAVEPANQPAGLRELEHHQLAARAEDATDLGQTLFEVFEVTDPEGDGDGVELVVGEGQLAAVAPAEGDVAREAVALDLPAPQFQHAFADVHARDLHGGQPAAGHDGHVPRAGGDVENVAGFQPPQLADGALPPPEVHPPGKETVQEVVAGGNVIKHRGHLFCLARLRIVVWDDAVMPVRGHGAKLQ